MTTNNTALDPIVHTLTNTTFTDIVAIGERMAADGDHLERMIWQIKAEAYGQFKAATAKYLEDEQKVQGSGKVADVVEAGNRIAELEKLWNQAVALRNRAVHFGTGQIDSSRWPALKDVYEGRKRD